MHMNMPSLERLEGRRLMSVVEGPGNVLYIEGTSRADTIELSPEQNQPGVFDVTISVRGSAVETKGITTASVRLIVVRANPQADVLRVDPSLAAIPVAFVSDQASGVTLADGVLAVQGGKGADVIRVYRNRGQAQDVTVVLNGQPTLYSSETVKTILV